MFIARLHIHTQTLLGLLAENFYSLARLCVRQPDLLIAHVSGSVHCDWPALAWLARQMLSSAHKGLIRLFRALHSNE